MAVIVQCYERGLEFLTAKDQPLVIRRTQKIISAP
jgi:hypothetical protein